ncbi:MAG: hypothetical protein JW902_12820 [Syntrophaceae bacterium]|nr:hypothetical protein [Syntrophaceae bacterium]
MVSFPLNLMLSLKDGSHAIHSNFILHVTWGGLFVFTEQPWKAGCVVFANFFIPPESRALAEFVGLILRASGEESPHPGMLVKFLDFGQKEMRRLVDFLEERKHLIDEKE